ncbi:MAG: CBS domain-containing protein [Cetobacterium sp.]|uniref:CBS domain-containing protein n=1 Tax=Cetobacterium sp. TaxID=2071632 RepID=UPI003F3897BE
MKLSSYLYEDEDFICTNLRGKDKNELIINLLSQVANKDSRVKERFPEILDAVLKREAEITTYIGHGVILPHAKLKNFDDFIVAIGLVKDDIQDKIPGIGNSENIKIMVLLLGDVLRNKNMLKTMGAFSKIALKNPILLEKIENSTTASEIVKLIEDANIEVDKKITAEDILNDQIKTASKTDKLDEIAKRFIVENKTGLPVVDENNKFLGEITERELIEFGMPKYISILDDVSFLTIGEPFEEYLSNEKTATIENIYRKEGVFVVDRKAAIMEVCFLMVNRGITRMYVVEDGIYYGMIERSDIIKKILHI